jgi:hypothetical protein
MKSLSTGGKATRFLRHYYIKCIILPRQARDKHRASTQKIVVARFLRGKIGKLDAAKRMQQLKSTMQELLAEAVSHEGARVTAKKARRSLDLAIGEAAIYQVRRRSLFLEFPLCLSRACLGKMLIYIYK